MRNHKVTKCLLKCFSEVLAQDMSSKWIWPAKASSIAISIKNIKCMRRFFHFSSFVSEVSKLKTWPPTSPQESMLKMQNIAEYIEINGNNKTNKKIAKDVDISKFFRNCFHSDTMSNGFGEDKVVKDWIHNLLQSKFYFGEAIFVLGPMGAGKTTTVEGLFKKHEIFKNYAYVDTDEVMEKLKGFDSERVEEFYPIARTIAIRLTDWLLEENISFIAEGTCVKYLELEDYMQRLKNRGYVIKVKYVNTVSLEEILKRTAKRSRKIPDSVVESIYHGSLKGVNELKKLNVDNSLFQEIL